MIGSIEGEGGKVIDEAGVAFKLLVSLDVREREDGTGGMRGDEGTGLGGTDVSGGSYNGGCVFATRR